MSSHGGSAVGERLLRDISGREDRQVPNRSEDYVGDTLGVKDGDVIRLVSQNINGIGSVANNSKEIRFKNFITDHDIDIMSFQQLNVCWSKLAIGNRIWDRFRG